MTEMLLVFDEICRRHDIQYWLCSGTLLGAVRHGGYIPWDDDLDVEILRPDYDKLMKILPGELPGNLQLQTPESDKGYFYAYAKLRDRRSHLEEANRYDRIFDMKGIYIDIFPMERIPQCLRWVSCRTLGRCYKVLKRTDISDDEARHRVRRIYWWNKTLVFPLLRALSRIIPTKKIRRSFGIPYDDVRLDAYMFPLQQLPFEGHMMPVPADSDAYLRDLFGDYMRLPDLDDLHPHTSTLTIED